MVRSLFLMLPLCCTACAMSAVDAPSLGKRAVEDLDFETPVAVAAADPVVALPPTIAGSVEEARAKSMAAHSSFEKDLPAVRSRVGAAGGAARESEAWVVAQTALAGLEVARAPSVEALSDLDRLYIAQADSELTENRIGGAAIIATVRAQVADQVEQQATAIAALKAGLR